jgi:serine/threonine protein kinase
MLADFGISRIMITATTISTQVATGTPYWMAPELFIDDLSSPKRPSDIWAFACICYEVKLF